MINSLGQDSVGSFIGYLRIRGWTYKPSERRVRDTQGRFVYGIKRIMDDFGPSTTLGGLLTNDDEGEHRYTEGFGHSCGHVYKKTKEGLRKAEIFP